MRRILLSMTLILFLGNMVWAQPRPGNGPKRGDMSEGWEVSVNQLDDQSRADINARLEAIAARGGATRGVLSDIFKSAMGGFTSGIVDVLTTEIINLAQYKKNKKRQWLEMIRNENNYTDSISSIKGLNDFYYDVSTKGALDPSNLNFNGISIRGIRRVGRQDQEVLYMSCHIDTTRLDHILHHSKFNLVLDTLAFYPYACHLPNLQANGIRLVPGETPERDCSFSFNERGNLTVGMEMILTSSWINEAVMVMSDVELGRFKLNVNIDKASALYTYSRRQILEYRNRHPESDTALIEIEGDCFVVPRSFMPTSGGKRMWGTGEYNIKVKFRESCNFIEDEDCNEKFKNWYRDYRQMVKMQKKHGVVTEYLRTVYQQHGNTIIKQMLKPAITTGVGYTGLSGSSGAAGSGARMPSGAGGMASGAGQGGGASGASGSPGASSPPGAGR